MNNFVLALAGLLVSFASVQAQKPSAADTLALIEMSRATTLAYSASLPDFVCTEVISRYRQVAVAAFAAPPPVKGRATPISGGAGTLSEPWQSLDKLTVKLTFASERVGSSMPRVASGVRKVLMASE